MYKYAEIYCGRVRDIKTSHLDFIHFSSIWSPNSFWVDVTGVDVEIGWVIKSNTEVGIYFEKPEELSIEKTLETEKAAKLELLSLLFSTHNEDAYITSSLGFKVNANEKAKQDINGLIISMEADNIDSIEFMDYDNILQLITLAELKIIQIEVIKNSNNLYKQKWELRDKIQNAESIDAVNNIEIVFYNYNFMLDEAFNENNN